MVHADYLFLMTDVDCLYDKNPRTNPSAKPIEVIADISTLEADVSTAGSALGTGGMMTKIVAARLATSAGVTTIITKSSKPGNIYNIITYLQSIKTPPRSTSPPPPAPESSLPTTEVPNGDAPPKPFPATAAHPLHTRFLPSPIPIRNRQFWLLHGLAPHGTIYIDHGAYRALKNKHGLLPVGIIAVEGTFSQQEAVRIVVADRPLSHSHTSSHSNSHSHSRTPSSQVVAAAVSLMDDTTGSGRITPVPDFVDGYSNPSSRPRTPTTPFRPKTPTPTSQDQPLKTHAEVGRALVNYSSTEIVRIKGLQSTEIGNVLGYADSEYVALRENVSLVGGGGEKEKDMGGAEVEERDREKEKERMGTLTDFA
jgi:glutamate 5-kinase